MPDRSKRPTEVELSMPIEAFAEKIYFECGVGGVAFDNYLRWLDNNKEE